MLRVTVELWPGGRETAKRVIATADIGRVADGAYAYYEAKLTEVGVGSIGTGHVRVPALVVYRVGPCCSQLSRSAWWQCGGTTAATDTAGVLLCTQRLKAPDTYGYAKSRNPRAVILSTGLTARRVP